MFNKEDTNRLKREYKSLESKNKIKREQLNRRQHLLKEQYEDQKNNVARKLNLYR